MYLCSLLFFALLTSTVTCVCGFSGMLSCGNRCIIQLSWRDGYVCVCESVRLGKAARGSCKYNSSLIIFCSQDSVVCAKERLHVCIERDLEQLVVSGSEFSMLPSTAKNRCPERLASHSSYLISSHLISSCGPSTRRIKTTQHVT